MSSIDDYQKNLQPPLFDQMPAKLRAGRYHVAWNAEQRKEKIGKTPYNARAFLDTGKLYRASSIKARSWSTFPQAQAAYQRGHFSGIGTILLPARRIVLVDIDHCIRTVLTEDGFIDEIKPAAQEIIDLLDTYGEKSPGQDGVHLFPLATLPPDTHNRYKYKDIEVEIYASERYTTLTGQHLLGTPEDLQERQGEVSALIERLTCWENENTSVCVCVLPGDDQPAAIQGQDDQARPVAQRNTRRRAGELPNTDDQARASQSGETNVSAKSAPQIREADLSLSDQNVLVKARAARNGQTFIELWQGGNPHKRMKPSGQPDVSAADFDLVLTLLYWCNDDADQVERIYRASGRYDEKTDRRTTKSGHSYLQMTIYNAIANRHKAPRRAPMASHAPTKSPPDPEPPTTPGPGAGKKRQTGRQDRRITHAHHWTRTSETPEERQQKLQDAANRIAELVEQHITTGSRTGLFVANVAPGVGKSNTVAPLGLPGGLDIAWIAERRNMTTSVAALQQYRQIEPCTRHNCQDGHHLHNTLGERGYNAWSIHKRHKLQCHTEPGHTGYAQQFMQSGSAVYQIAHVATRYPASHQGIIIDELDVTKWLPEREITGARLSAAARVYATDSTPDLFLRAIGATLTDAAQAKKQLHGLELFNALNKRAGGQLANWIAELSQDGRYTNTHPWYELEEEDDAAQELEAATLAPVVLPHILVALIRELVRWQRGQAWNSCLRVGPGAHGQALYITERRHFTPGEDGLPARAILDATADAEILTRLTGEQIQLVQADITPPPGTRHLAIRTGKRYGKMSLTTKRKDGSPNRDLQRAIAEARYILREEDPDGEARTAQTIGLVSFMGCVAELGDALGIPEHRRLHFWAARGSNALEDCTILLVIGTPCIHPATVARLTRALYQDDPEPVSEATELDPQGIRRYLDPRMQRVDSYLTHAELTQCAHRSRALRAPRTVVTYCLGDIGYLPPTETITELPQLTSDGRERRTVSRQVEREKLVQAHTELELEGRTVAMFTVRELKARAGVSTDAAADYLRQIRPVAQQEARQVEPEQDTHTHTHLCSHTPIVPESANIDTTCEHRYKLENEPPPQPIPVIWQPRPGTETTPPEYRQPCARCGHVDDWQQDRYSKQWLCSCYWWWYEHPERRGPQQTAMFA